MSSNPLDRPGANALNLMLEIVLELRFGSLSI